METRRGDYCWCCNSHPAPEKFSDGNLAHRLCRDCAKLGREELVYRQAMRRLEQCATWDGLIRRSQQRVFEEYLHHSDPRVRALAEKMRAQDHVQRACQQALGEAEAASFGELYQVTVEDIAETVAIYNEWLEPEPGDPSPDTSVGRGRWRAVRPK